MKEHQTFDDGDLLQSESPKVLVFEYTCFVLCVMCMVPLLMLIDFFKREGKCWKRISEIYGRKENTRIVQFKYIDDIHVMVVFSAC